MRVHHLNCATMCPAGGRLMDGRRGLLRTAKMVAHCLLVESEDGLILVDTGLGSEDVAHPRRRVGSLFVASVRPALDAAETAAAQVEGLGFDLGDVRHIVLTHLDLDHAGGLSDFPEAQVHVLDTEHTAAMHPRTLIEHKRYSAPQWAHGPHWAIHGERGEPWMGFESVEAVAGLLLVPLHGHTRGHCGVAVPVDSGWLLHCGDAYFFHGEVEERRTCPPGLRAFQRIMAIDDKARRHNQQRLRELRRTHGGKVTLHCAHDPVELQRLQG